MYFLTRCFRAGVPTQGIFFLSKKHLLKQCVYAYKHNLGGGFKRFLCSPLFGEDSHFDYYNICSKGLKPPTDNIYTCHNHGDPIRPGVNGWFFVVGTTFAASHSAHSHDCNWWQPKKRAKSHDQLSLHQEKTMPLPMWSPCMVYLPIHFSCFP